MTATLDDKHTKELFKQAMLELMSEQREIFYDLFVETLEDLLMVAAIREGEATESISRKEILQILEGAS